MNEIIYFTLAAILLYAAADKILSTAERLAGGHFKHRSLIFFAIIMILAVGTFQILQYVLPAKEPAKTVEATQPTQQQAEQATEAQPAPQP